MELIALEQLPFAETGRARMIVDAESLEELVVESTLIPDVYEVLMGALEGLPTPGALEFVKDEAGISVKPIDHNIAISEFAGPYPQKELEVRALGAHNIYEAIQIINLGSSDMTAIIFTGPLTDDARELLTMVRDNVFDLDIKSVISDLIQSDLNFVNIQMGHNGNPYIIVKSSDEAIIIDTRKKEAKAEAAE